MFQITAVPFDAFNDLPDDCRWIAVALARYADKAGRCWPTMRQIAALIRVSPATVCRRLKKLADLGVFHRKRQGVGRYVNFWRYGNGIGISNILQCADILPGIRAIFSRQTREAAAVETEGSISMHPIRAISTS